VYGGRAPRLLPMSRARGGTTEDQFGTSALDVGEDLHAGTTTYMGLLAVIALDEKTAQFTRRVLIRVAAQSPTRSNRAMQRSFAYGIRVAEECPHIRRYKQ
jgi:hypothetical protein